MLFTILKGFYLMTWAFWLAFLIMGSGVRSGSVKKGWSRSWEAVGRF